MTNRATRILEAVIQEFIDTGEPVSSGSLYERYDFGIKPAMIRLELDALEEAGYLEQPYHSSGRVPSDRGYEFFAERALASGAHDVPRKSSNELLNRHAWAELMAELSGELSLLSVIADFSGDAVYKAGLQELVEHLDWENKAVLRSVIRDFEEVDERLPMTAPMSSAGLAPLAVFIGKKSPVTRSECLSVIRGNYAVGDAIVSIFAIGPKNMDYKKVITVFKNL